MFSFFAFNSKLLSLTTLFPLLSLFTAALAAPLVYNLVEDYSGATFFDGFETYTGPDPTNGHVNYTDLAFAAAHGLVSFNHYPDTNSTRAIISVDTTNPAPEGRNSVRLTSKATFNVGTLVLMDFYHVPTGFGIWPAAWLLGTGGVWPSKGEIDILEYVHNDSSNAVTLHTGPGCEVLNSTASASRVQGQSKAKASFLGHLQNADCNHNTAFDGCSIHTPATYASPYPPMTHLATAGAPLNAQGGGVYVTEWTTAGISVWSFARSAVPATLNSDHPSTTGWPAPIARFSGPGCDYAKTFGDMALQINTDCCGDWAGKVWEESGAAAATGVETCNDYVSNHPEAFKEAYWEIGGIKIFSNGAKPGVHGEDFSRPDGETSRAGWFAKAFTV